MGDSGMETSSSDLRFLSRARKEATPVTGDLEGLAHQTPSSPTPCPATPSGKTTFRVLSSHMTGAAGQSPGPGSAMSTPYRVLTFLIFAKLLHLLRSFHRQMTSVRREGGLRGS